MRLGFVMCAGRYNFIVTSNVRGAASQLRRAGLHWVRLPSSSHIPKKVYDEFQGVEKPEGISKIPGYAGYVPAIKPENIYGNTFGKTTLDVNTKQYVKGQDLRPKPSMFHQTLST